MKAILSKSEQIEAENLAQWLGIMQRQKRIQVYAHIPNETYTPYWSQINKNKAAGVNSGVPDYIIVIDNYVLFLELKVKKGGVVSKEQREWLLYLSDKQTQSTVANGFEEAKEWISKYLKPLH